MSKKVTKISKLKNIESFLQINYLKGFRYIDRVGEILNLYQSDLGSITYDMSPDRLVIPKPIVTIEELKISNIDFWCHYVMPGNLGESERIFKEEAVKLLEIIKVETVLRVGWRNYYVYELTNKLNNLDSVIKIGKSFTQELHTRLDFKEDIKASVLVKLLKQKKDEKRVLLIDLDVYLDKKANLTEGLQAFRKLRNTIESTEILEFINEIITKLTK